MTSDKWKMENRMEDISLWRDLFSLSGKVALVTGGTRGLGNEIARTLARSGAKVAICSRSAEGSEMAAQEIADHTGQQVLSLYGDVADFQGISQIVADTREQLGPIDILVANAGTNIRKSAEQMTAEEWDSVVSLNLKGAFLLAKSVLPEMKERGYGRVVFLGSIHSHISLAGYSAYAASKAGLLGLTRALALEYAAHGICVNSLCPGFMKTPLTSPLRENSKTEGQILDKTPAGRWGEPEDLRGVILLLCSSSGSFITGTSILVDGGWTAQ